MSEWIEERERYLGRKMIKRIDRTLPFALMLRNLMKAASKRAQGGYNSQLAVRGKRSSDYFELGTVWDELEYVLIGGKMEMTDVMLKKVNDEVKESKVILQNLVNEVKAVNDLLQPELLKTVLSIRTSRETVTRELSKALTTMRDVRKFFLESDYKEEMERLERFVALGERMKALINDGTMDAVCDMAIKLAVGEEEAK